MVIAELKSSWKLMEDQFIKNDLVDEKTIRSAIHQKSKTEMAILKRGLRTKLVIGTIAVLAASMLALLSYYLPNSIQPFDLHFSPLEYSLFFGIMGVSVAVMVLFNFKAFRKLQQLEGSSFNIRKNLQAFVDAMQTARRFNVLSDTLMSPVIFTWVYYAYAFEDHSLKFDLRGILLLLLPLGIAVFSYFLQTYMQQLKFGNYVNKLKEYLENLEKNGVDL